MQKAIRFSIKTFCFVVHDKLVRKRRLNRGLFHLGKPIGRLGKQARLFFLTSSSCHPKVFVKEFCYFLMSCHQHCLGVNLLVQR